MPTKPKIFARNIGKNGRLLRGLGAVALISGGFVALKVSLILSLVLLAGGAFVLFEALRGWCALRACGIKTKF
ncbi:MAG: YgaP-like transmembrane domain [Verrucomicrobiota bacterium]